MVRTLQRPVLAKNRLLGRLPQATQGSMGASQLLKGNPVTESEDDVLCHGVRKRRPRDKTQSR